MAGKALRQHEAVACCEAVAGAVWVYHAAAAFEDVAELHIACAVGAERSGGGFPYTAAQLLIAGGEALQRQIGGVAADGAAGLAGLGAGEVLGFDTNQFGHECSEKRSCLRR